MAATAKTKRQYIRRRPIALNIHSQVIMLAASLEAQLPVVRRVMSINDETVRLYSQHTKNEPSIPVQKEMVQWVTGNIWVCQGPVEELPLPAKQRTIDGLVVKVGDTIVDIEETACSGVPVVGLVTGKEYPDSFRVNLVIKWTNPGKNTQYDEAHVIRLKDGVWGAGVDGIRFGIASKDAPVDSRPVFPGDKVLCLDNLLDGMSVQDATWQVERNLPVSNEVDLVRESDHGMTRKRTIDLILRTLVYDEGYGGWIASSVRDTKPKNPPPQKPSETSTTAVPSSQQEASLKQIQLRKKKAAHLMKILCDRLKLYVPVNVSDFLQSESTGKPYHVKMYDLENQLFELCSNMTDEQKDKHFYNGRDPMARKLADWWDWYRAVLKHNAKRKLDVIRKLTAADRVILGFGDVKL